MEEDVTGDAGAATPDRDAWTRVVESGGRTLASFSTRLREGITLQPLYTAADRPTSAALRAAPGEAPFVRGVSTDEPIRLMHYEAAGAARVNAQILDDLAGGMSGLAIRVDRRGRTASVGEDDDVGTGEGGVAIDSLADLARALDEVRLDLVTTWIDAGGNALPAAAMFLALAEQRGVDARDLRVHFGCDPLGALARDGALAGTIEDHTREMSALAHYASRELPHARAVTVSVAPYHHAGCDAAQEIAFALATGVDYVRRLVDDGLSLDDAAKQIGFDVAVGRELFLEIGKIRALRLLWASALRALGLPSGAPAFVRAGLSARIMTRRDPWVNMLRATGGSFAAIVAGADAVSVLPYDAFRARPSELGRRVARNTLNVLIEEAQVDAVADPAGGSYYLDALTDELGRVAWDAFREIERAGGMGEALVGGLIRREVDERYLALVRAIRTRKMAITGVSRFPDLDEKPPEAAIPDPAVEAAIRQREEARRAGGETPAVVDTSVVGLIAAARAGATIGALGCALDRGASATSQPFSLRRDAVVFEALRDAADAHAAGPDGRPRVALVTLGALAEHQARSKFARNAFGVGGFAADEINVPVADRAEQDRAVAESLASSSTCVACICGTDEHYADAVPSIAASLVAQGVEWIAVAGRAGDHEAAWRDAGVTTFVHLGSNLSEQLVGALRAAGVGEVSE